VVVFDSSDDEEGFEFSRLGREVLLLVLVLIVIENCPAMMRDSPELLVMWLSE
jgi:hypothetical protein